MRSDISAVAFILLFLIFFAVFGNSCSEAAVSDPFSYADRDFDADMSGTVDGQKFEALVQWRQGEGEQEGKLCVRFTYPDTVSDITVTLDEAGGSALKLGDIVYEGDGAESAALPFFSVLGRGEVRSVEKNGSGELCVTVVSEQGELLYVFAEKSSLPVNVSGTVSGVAIDFDIKNGQTPQ